MTEQQELEELRKQMQNVREILQRIRVRDGDDPKMEQIDIANISCPLDDDLIPGTNTLMRNGLGGDHLIYIDFTKRFDLDERIRLSLEDGRVDVADKLHLNKQRRGLLVADVSGHDPSDSIIAFALHQSLLEGVRLDIERYGEITPRVFESLNTRFWKTTSIQKFITLLYGEIWETGRFRYISAGHPGPKVYSRVHERFVTLPPPRNSLPIGLQPSEADVDRALYTGPHGFKKPYVINEIGLIGKGDILLLASDGLWEHGKDLYATGPLEACVRNVQDRSAREIALAIWDDMNAYAPRTDDVTMVVVKKR